MRLLEGFTAVLYARVSTDDKDQTTASQIREMEAWCLREGVEIIGTYSEERSAGDLDRPEWDRLMGRIARGGVNILLAWSESRISRSTEDMTAIEKLLRTFNVRIRYVSSSVAPETPEGSLINHIWTWQAQQEREKLRINTKNGMLTRKIQGIHCGRPLAIVLAHNIEKEKARINEKTKIITLDSIMEYAAAGWSLPKTAAAFGVTPDTLRRVLLAEDELERFRGLAKGVPCTRVGSINIEAEK